MADYIYLVQMDIPPNSKTSLIGSMIPNTSPIFCGRRASMAVPATGLNPPTPLDGSVRRRVRH